MSAGVDSSQTQMVVAAGLTNVAADRFGSQQKENPLLQFQSLRGSGLLLIA